MFYAHAMLDGIQSLFHTGFFYSMQAGTSLAVSPKVYLAATEELSIFSINPGIVIWTWIAFAVTFIVLYFFAWKPILKMLAGREHRIAQSLENAEKVERSLKETEEKSAAMLAETKQQSRILYEKALVDAEKVKFGIEEEAKKQAKIIVENAKQAIDNEKRLALQQLREASSHLVVQAASKLIEQNLDDEKNSQLAHKYLNQMKL